MTARLDPFRSSRRRRVASTAFWFLFAASLVGCTAEVPIARLPLHLEPFVATGGHVNHEALSLVLGRVGSGPPGPITDVTARHTLARYLATLAMIGPRRRPELFSTDSDVIAYLIDAHVAWTLALHDREGLAPTVAGDVRSIRFPLDGGASTLADLEERVIRRAPGEPLVVLCLNPGLAGGPPLPVAALEGHSLEWQVHDQAIRCGRTSGLWSIDADTRSLAVSEFTEYMHGLPVDRQERMLRLLSLVPPPPPLQHTIETVCGPTLAGCSFALLPLSPER